MAPNGKAHEADETTEMAPEPDKPSMTVAQAIQALKDMYKWHGIEQCLIRLANDFYIGVKAQKLRC